MTRCIVCGQPQRPGGLLGICFHFYDPRTTRCKYCNKFIYLPVHEECEKEDK